MLEKGEAVSWRRFRIGHSLELAAFRCRIGLETNDTCRRCGAEPEDNTHVLLRCTYTRDLRQKHGISKEADMVNQPRAAYKLWCWFRGRPPETVPPND